MWQLLPSADCGRLSCCCFLQLPCVQLSDLQGLLWTQHSCGLTTWLTNQLIQGLHIDTWIKLCCHGGSLLRAFWAISTLLYVAVTTGLPAWHTGLRTIQAVAQWSFGTLTLAILCACMQIKEMGTARVILGGLALQQGLTSRPGVVESIQYAHVQQCTSCQLPVAVQSLGPGHYLLQAHQHSSCQHLGIHC